MGFVRDAWYMAAWSADIKDAPVGRRILGEPLIDMPGAKPRDFTIGDAGSARVRRQRARSAAAGQARG